MDEIVIIQHRKAVTTSLKVAEVFGKRHNHILRDIEKIKHDLPDDAQPILGLSEYVDPTGRPLPMYQMSRDGFTLLAMGFTGKAALEFKLKYIAAFNLMEQTLLNQQNLSWR